MIILFRKTTIVKYTSDAYNLNVLYISLMLCSFTVYQKQNYIAINPEMFFKSKSLVSITIHIYRLSK